MPSIVETNIHLDNKPQQRAEGRDADPVELRAGRAPGHGDSTEIRSANPP